MSTPTNTSEKHTRPEQGRRIPQLRFKEFEGEWEKTKFEEVIDRITYGFTNPMPEAEDGPYLLTARDVNYGQIQYETCRRTTQEAFDTLVSDKSRPNVGDILLTKDGTLGRVALVDQENCCINQSVALIQPGDHFESQYLKQLLLSPAYQNEMLRNAGGSTIKHLYITTVGKMKVICPTLPEQEKIASFLSGVDDKIQQLSRKKELLEQYKKGVMQQLFSYKKRLGDSKLRKGTLGDFGSFYYGKGAPKTTIEIGAPTPCVRYGELYSTYNEEIKEIKSYTTVPPCELKLSKGGEVLVPRVGEKPLEFANCSYLPFADVAIGEMISVYNTEEDGLFMTYYINARLKKQLARMVEGGNVSNLYFRYVEKIEVEIPSIEEQQEIINFLSGLDAKIASVGAQITQSQTFKKGLLQQMFV